MSGATGHRQRRQVRWFVALHVGAVAGIYVLALSVGGGYAMAPFPVNERVTARQGGQSVDVNVAPRHAPPAQERSDPVPYSRSADLAAPWSYGSDGRAHLHAH